MYSKIKFKNFSMVIYKKLSDFQRDPSPVDKLKNRTVYLSFTKPQTYQLNVDKNYYFFSIHD